MSNLENKQDVKVYKIKDKIEYLKEVITLEYNEWAKDKETDYEKRIEEKINKVKNMLNENDFCKLILLKGNTLVGFISIFSKDLEEFSNLTPWYATMYVKKEFRGNGYSRILDKAIKEEAKKRGFKELYLKTDIKDYYEKFGAKYITNINETEKLYKMEL